MIIQNESHENSDAVGDVVSDPCGQILENLMDIEPMELEIQAVQIQSNETQQLSIVSHVTVDNSIVEYHQGENQSSDCNTAENKKVAAPEFEIVKDASCHENEAESAETNEDDKFEDAIAEPFEQSIALIDFSSSVALIDLASPAEKRIEAATTSQEHQSVDVANKSMALQNSSNGTFIVIVFEI